MAKDPVLFAGWPAHRFVLVPNLPVETCRQFRLVCFMSCYALTAAAFFKTNTLRFDHFVLGHASATTSWWKSGEQMGRLGPIDQPTMLEPCNMRRASCPWSVGFGSWWRMPAAWFIQDSYGWCAAWWCSQRWRWYFGFGYALWMLPCWPHKDLGEPQGATNPVIYAWGALLQV